MKEEDTRLKSKEFLPYLLKNWFISTIKTSWRLTHNPVIARIAAEDAGKRIFRELIEEPDEWTSENWIEAVTKHIPPLSDAEPDFFKTDEYIEMHVKLCITPGVMKEDRYATCSFCYGTLKSLFKGAFPQGELHLSRLISKGAPSCEFRFIFKPTEEDRMKATEDLKNIFSK